MPRPLTSREIVGFAAAVGLLAAAVAGVHFLTPNVRKSGFVEGVPLLKQDGAMFTDSQVSLRFTPPPDWSMQARSADSPTNHRAERMLVKYKQFVPGIQSAWLRVGVADAAENKSPADLLRAKKPPDVNWKVVKEIEDGFTVGGRPAARITFGGPFDPDGKGQRDFTCETVAVTAGPHSYTFAGTFLSTDRDSRQRIRTAIDTATFDRK